MKSSRPIIAVGIIVVVLGIVFHLQGQAVVGPHTSFMYSNPEWITYGIEIIIVGVSIIVFGVLSKIFWKG
jgi:uncharacterized membrane protein